MTYPVASEEAQLYVEHFGGVRPAVAALEVPYSTFYQWLHPEVRIKSRKSKRESFRRRYEDPMFRLREDQRDAIRRNRATMARHEREAEALHA